MATVHIRYLVDHVEAAIRFYTTHLGFSLLSSAALAFADVTRGDLRLLLSGPRSSAGRPMPDGRRPSLGGGTEFISSSKTSPRRSRATARLVCGSAATLSLDLVRSVRCSGQCQFSEAMDPGFSKPFPPEFLSSDGALSVPDCVGSVRSSVRSWIR